MGFFNDFIKNDFDPSTAQAVHLGSSTYQVVPSPDNNVYFKGSVTTDEDGNKVVNGDFYVYSGKSMKQLNMDETDFDAGSYVTQNKEHLAQKDLNSLVQPSWETISVQQDVKLGKYMPPLTDPNDIFEKMRNEGSAEDREIALMQKEKEQKDAEETVAQKNANVDQGVENILDFPPKSTITENTTDKDSIWQGPPQRQDGMLSPFSTAISASAHSPYSNRDNSIYSGSAERAKAGQIRYKVSDTTWMVTRAASDMVTKQLLKSTNTKKEGENPEMAAANFENTISQTRTYVSLARSASTLLVGGQITRIREFANRDMRKYLMNKYHATSMKEVNQKISQSMNELNIKYTNGKYAALQLKRMDMKIAHRQKIGDTESLLEKQEKIQRQLDERGKDTSFRMRRNDTRLNNRSKYQDEHFVSMSGLNAGYSREELVVGGRSRQDRQRDVINDRKMALMCGKMTAKQRAVAQLKRTKNFVNQANSLLMNQLAKTEAGQGLTTTTKVVRLSTRSLKTTVKVTRRSAKMMIIIAKKIGIDRLKNKISETLKRNKLERMDKKIEKAQKAGKKARLAGKRNNIDKYGRRPLKRAGGRFKDWRAGRKGIRSDRRKKRFSKLSKQAKKRLARMRRVRRRVGKVGKAVAKPFKVAGKAIKTVARAISSAFTIVKIWIGIIIAIIALIIILLAAYENTMVQQYAGALDVNGSTGVLKGEEDEDIVADDEEAVTAEDFEEITEEEADETGED